MCTIHVHYTCTRPYSELRYLRKQRRKVQKRLTKDADAHREAGEITRQEQLFGLQVQYAHTCTLVVVAQAHVVYVCSLASLQSITGPEVACFLMLIYHCLSLDSKLSMYLIVMHNEYTFTRV